MRIALSITLVLAVSGAQALSQCPPDIECIFPPNMEVQIVASLDTVASSCSKLTPADASRFSDLAEQFFADRKEVVRKSRANKDYPSMTKKSEAEILKYSPEKQKQECARVLQELSELKKHGKKAAE